MAFGTGLHPTTRRLPGMLQEVEPMPARVLDVGSGSGILGIAALALGAGTVEAVDTDPEAVTATAANAAVNGVADRLSVRQGTLDGAPAEPYPLVLANLVAAVLIELAPRLAAHLAPAGRCWPAGSSTSAPTRWRRCWRPPACRAPSAGSTASGSRCGCCAQ